MFDPPITTTGTINDTSRKPTYDVTLPNGKIIIGHLPKSQAPLREVLQSGDVVNLELTPYDLEKARIVGVVSSSDVTSDQAPA
ncbi:translation initiation factor IF-1 [Verrucomicrobiaceae bacterium N1E253]|uniref:Translation initiation factor IF-1 n=1 Tax=Oceaniferula marina TaxID=2748318 RepID=A0A851GAC5_9BACT|nr:translation initiation factor IF-1 [Oceaniferula marina]NWK54356.1 translation initiation factor IF-1 [Oceaniferula marina]